MKVFSTRNLGCTFTYVFQINEICDNFHHREDAEAGGDDYLALLGVLVRCLLPILQTCDGPCVVTSLYLVR